MTLSFDLEMGARMWYLTVTTWCVNRLRVLGICVLWAPLALVDCTTTDKAQRASENEKGRQEADATPDI